LNPERRAIERTPHFNRVGGKGQSGGRRELEAVAAAAEPGAFEVFAAISGGLVDLAPKADAA
jgi:hypothetical protein